MARTRRAWSIVVLALLALAALVFVVPAMAEGAPSAKALEAKLLAPCCYGGTLDIHDSEMSRELRHEIEDRVARGESTEAVENDFVERYGSRVRALPNEKAMSNVITGLLAMFGISGAVLVTVMVRRSSKQRREDDTDGARAKKALAGKAQPRDALDDRLDAELEDV
jgi:cytochrome c-type biogenesis protein CcmH